MEKIKSNLTYVICTVLGLLNFIFFAIPYISAYVEYGSTKMSEGVSGYSVMTDMWDAEGFSAVMSALLQLIAFIAGIALLVIGILGLVKAFANIEQIPAKLMKLGSLGLLVMAALNVLLLVFLIIFVASNSESMGSMSAGYSLSAGIFIAVIASVGAVVVEKLLNKKLASAPASDSEQ